MERQTHQFRKSGRAHLLLGIVLMFIGLFLIADMADIIPWRLRDFLFTWQALLIFLGIIFLSGREGKATGLILIVIGSFFLLPKFFAMPYYWRSLFWPSMLILLGVIVIISSGRHGTVFSHKKKVSGDDILDDVAVFGGGDRIINSQQFQGGKITNIFGGSKYDMTNARLTPGKNYLDVIMIFGGSRFIIPDDWNLKLEVTAIFGGLSDKRVKSIVVKDQEQVLIIRGITLFGGGELVNYR